jgi:hypothetical protein
MKSWQKSGFASAALLLAMSVLGVEARAQESSRTIATPCFSIHVRVDGKPVEGPQSIILKTNDAERLAISEAGCLRVPVDLLSQQAVDVIFTVPGNKVHLSAIAPRFFAGPWDVELEDKRFGSEVVLPQRARGNEICAVVFHVGEPETAVTQTSCRTPL